MTAIEIQDLQSLRIYVEQTICDQNELETGAYAITERVLARGGRPCGIMYCLQGPRSVQFTAIWETDRNTILFYGSAGERQTRVQLVQAPKLQAATASA